MKTLDIYKWVRCKWEEADQHRKRTLCGSIGLEGKWSEWENGRGPLGRAGLEVVYRRKQGIEK